MSQGLENILLQPSSNDGTLLRNSLLDFVRHGGGTTFAPDSTPLHLRRHETPVIPEALVALDSQNLEMLQLIRPGTEKIKELCADRRKGDDFLSRNQSPVLTVDRSIACNVLRNRADSLFKEGKYVESAAEYGAAARSTYGQLYEVPKHRANGVRDEVYVSLEPWAKVDLMACCNGIGSCMRSLGKIELALCWFEEVQTLYTNGWFSSDSVYFEWQTWNYPLTEYFSQRVVAYLLACDTFSELGNTGAATHRIHLASTVADATMPPELNPHRTIGKMIDRRIHLKLAEYRHPDPHLVPNLSLQNTALQVRGSWRKLKPRKFGILSRLGFASFVYESVLYVAGGQHASTGPFLRDFWCLDLQKMDVWRELPSYPVSSRTVPLFRGLGMAVHEDKAYLFTGRPEVDFFDLTARKWGSVKTRFKRTDGKQGTARWLYPHDLSGYAMHMINGQLFVFGGDHNLAGIGCNLLCVLDVVKREWTHLSGTLEPVPDYLCPGPRKWSASWVNPRKDTIYIMQGLADRAAAHMFKQKHACEDSIAYDDFWSWHIPTRKWKREKINGNPPCARAEMASTYNEQLDKTIVFGGYNPLLETCSGRDIFPFTYFADTFIFCHTTFTWKQVLTRGFPTYRAQSQFLTDPATGRTFLFGGFTNSDWLKDNRRVAFADLWELQIDGCGSGFDPVEWEAEKRTATAGPWQRCFACGSVGRWMKCGGVCRGQVFFCDASCLKEGWKEHKNLHNCRKA